MILFEILFFHSFNKKDELIINMGIFIVKAKGCVSGGRVLLNTVSLLKMKTKSNV